MSQTKSRPNSGAWRLPALAAGLTLSAAGASLAATSEPAHDIRPVSGWSSVIVKTGGTLTPAQAAQVTALGGDVTHRLPIISALAVRIPSRNLAKLAGLPFVAHVSPDGLVRKSDDFTVGSSEADQAPGWGQSGGYQLTGQGVTVAVVDSGVANVPDLGGGSPIAGLNVGGNRLVASFDFVPHPTPGAPPSPGGPDPCGHGTHVAGIIAGNGSKSSDKKSFRTFFGIAPEANVVSYRVLDQNGQTAVSTVIYALQQIVAYNANGGSSSGNSTNKDDGGKNAFSPIRIVNLSLGHPVGESYTTDPLCQAVEAVYKAGIVVVCAAGNEGRANAANDPIGSNEGWGTAYGSIQSPANDPCVITVGATKSKDGQRADDKIATYSSRGPSRLDLVLKPDVIAPGNKVISLDANNSTLDNYAGGTNDIPQSLYQYVKKGDPVSNDYFQLSGTSMAAPVVAGAAALLLQANPSLTPDTVKARLMLSADKWADPTGSPDPLTYGAGYLNIPAALASTATATLPALSPTLIQNGDGSVSLVMDRAAWGTTTGTTGSQSASGTGLWGTGVTDLRAAWGTSVTFAPGVTADRAAWGTNALTSSRAAWGTSTVWADRAAWGTSTSAVDLTATALVGDPPSVTTHVLWNNPDGRVLLWNVSSDGSRTASTYGPYDDGAPNSRWHAAALATGPDGLSHLLWTNPDGRVILWTVDEAGAVTDGVYGPYTDGSPNTPWSAKALSVGADGLVHLLWTNPDGRVILWNVDKAFHPTLAIFGPYTDGSAGTPWTATALATGPDNVSRLLWNNPDGNVALWNVDDAFNLTLASYGPYTDGSPNTPWSAAALSVGPDNVTHLLWTNPDTKVILWNLDTAGNVAAAAFGPYTDGSPSTPWGASALATGPDGVSRLLWTNPDGNVALWGVDSAFNFNVAGYGLLTDGAPQNVWAATAVSAGP